MPNPGGQFFAASYGDIEDYFISDSWLLDQYIGDVLWGWGLNNAALGNNNTTSSSTPVTTFSGGTNWKSVVCNRTFGTSNGHVVALKTDGTLWVWGSSVSGTNDTNTRTTPVTTFAGGNNWKSITTGYNHSAAIKTDGTLWVWGTNNNGQLGINNTIGRSTPVTTFAGGTNWKSVACGYNSTAAIKTDGTLWTWGLNSYGFLGINISGTTTGRTTPVTTFVGGTNWRQVSASFACTAIKTDGTLWVWGYNNTGILGTNDTNNRSIPVTTFAGGNNWKNVSSSTDITSAIKTDGTLWSWGSNTNGQLGDNTGAGTDKLTPITTFAGGNNWKSVATGNNHSVAIKTDGTLWVWGANNNGQLGINNTTDKSTPVTTFLGGNNWKSIFSANNGNTTFAVTAGFNVDLS